MIECEIVHDSMLIFEIEVYMCCMCENDVNNSNRMLVLTFGANLGWKWVKFVTGSWNENLGFWIFAQRWTVFAEREWENLGRMSHGRGHGRVMYWNVFVERPSCSLSELKKNLLRWATNAFAERTDANFVVRWAKGENVVLVLRCRIVENEVEWLNMTSIAEYLRC